MAVSFIGGDPSTRGKPQTCRKSLTKESKQFIQSDSSHSNNGDTSDNEIDKLARNVR
jgi:hypothetical protein